MSPQSYKKLVSLFLFLSPSLSPSPPSLSLSLTQVLSSRLMPTGDQEKDESSTQLFRRNFLESGGLKSVINVLQRNALPSDVDLTIRQDCYAISLALARYVYTIYTTGFSAEQWNRVVWCLSKKDGSSFEVFVSFFIPHQRKRVNVEWYSTTTLPL